MAATAQNNKKRGVPKRRATGEPKATNQRQFIPTCSQPPCKNAYVSGVHQSGLPSLRKSVPPARGTRVLRNRIESGGDPCGIESKSETARHEGEVLKNFEIGLWRDELREALDRDKQHDDPEDHRGRLKIRSF